jgi:glycosyltransferase involved in cell wall biosynthesis
VKIAIDIRRMNEFGVGTYTRNVVRALGQLDQKNEYVLIGAPKKVAEIGSLPANFQSIPLLNGEATTKGYFECRAILRQINCDLVHIPHLFWMPRSLPCPYVITVHDVLEHMYRAHDNSGLRRSVHFHLTRRVLKGAARILAVSKFTKSEIEKLFNIPSTRIEVVYNAIDQRFLHGHATDADRQLLAALANHGVKQIDTSDGKFDPNRHQAIAEVAGDGKPGGSIVNVVQTGYMIGDRILRPALVGVSKGGAKSAPAAADGSAA